MNVFTLVFGGLGAFALTHHYRFSIYVFLIATLFGTAAALQLPGGQAVLVAHFFLAFFCLRTLMRFGLTPFLDALVPPRAGFFVLMLVLYGMVSVFLILPFFQGKVTVFALQQVNDIVMYTLQPLYRGGSNFNQLFYMVANLVTFCTAFVLFRSPGAYRHAGNALILLAALNVMMALLDLVTWRTGTSDLLLFMKNGNFTYMDDNEIGGLKRISGSFSEASAFAGFTLRLLAVTLTLWLSGLYQRWSGYLSAALFVLLVLSTSTTAYIGLAVALSVTFLPAAGRALSERRSIPHLGKLSLIALLALTLLALIAVVSPRAFDPLLDMLDTLLFSKLSSDSGHERGSWNAQAYQLFLDTWGLGAGVGSTRSSSSLMALLSNVGIPGTLLYTAFAATALMARYAPDLTAEERNIVRACRNGLVTSMFAQLFTAGTIDMGIINAMLFGVSASAAAPRLLLPRRVPEVRRPVATGTAFARNRSDSVFRSN